VTRRVEDPARRSEHKTALAKSLRQQATATERILWALLRKKTFGAARFRRQQPIGPYVADFYCSAAKLIVELDGSQHSEPDNVEYDEARTSFLSGLGYRVVRVTNHDLLQHREETLEQIWRALREVPPSP
jgi:very-short-patch-repair endonuclease